VTDASPQAPQVPAAPAALERGRYALFGDGKLTNLVISRATNLCQSCSSCGCGDQQEIISIGAIIRDMMRHPADMMKAARAMMRGDGDGEGDGDGGG